MNKEQLERYNRHIILSEIGVEGQKKLLDAKVLVVGAGGLGAPALQYLVAAGVGNIGIVDADTVSLSNLQRQILYRENQIDQSKAEQAKQTLNQLNSDVQITTYPFMIDDTNAEEIISGYDLIVGATDNFESRKCIDRISKQQGKAFVHGSIGEFEGQISVLNHNGGPSYFDLFSDTPDETTMPLGVLGVLPGIIGSMQACEVIKIILGIGDVLSGKLLIYDALTHNTNVVNF
ncbi:HesA/MoeB/ThiF family protein [Marinifilum sp.]|uniref:HesA/MoeB/ThiF family protein n=1 Tax=Marinifilum sp. TaxID=2033137 RepID=UPI003BA8843B